MPTETLELAGDFTSIASRWNNGTNYFHWFMDGLTRLVHLGHFPDQCRILVPNNLPAFAKRSLDLLGLENRIQEVGDADLRIERYWFAGPTMLSGCPDPIGVKWLRDRFLRGPEPEKHRRIYLERNAATRNLTNSAEVRTFFQQQRWEIVDTGRLDLDAQIRLFREARMVAGVHGAGLTNLLWASPGTHVLELMPTRRRNACYAGISAITGLSHQILLCPSDRFGTMAVPMVVLAKQVARISAYKPE